LRGLKDSVQSSVLGGWIPSFGKNDVIAIQEMIMHRWTLIGLILLFCAACSKPTTDPLNPPDAPEIPPSRSMETKSPATPVAPGTAPAPTVPAR
jgi:hypothetical protein